MTDTPYTEIPEESSQTVTVSRDELKARGLWRDPFARRTEHPGTPPVILDNGAFPKTTPGRRRRTAARWRRLKSSR